MTIGKMKIIRRAIHLLTLLSKLTRFDTFTVRSIPTQRFSQPSKYEHNFKAEPINTQSN